MKTSTLIILSLISISHAFCKGQEQSKSNGTFATELLVQFANKRIWDIAFDSNKDLYILTSERDTSVHIPPGSSYIPTLYKLLKKDIINGELTVVDNNFPLSNKIIFDGENNLWAISDNALFRRNKGIINTIITDSRFDFIAVDGQNNIWTGGCCVTSKGLYKIDKNLNIKLFDKNNSELATNNISNIHIDNQDNIWVALRDNFGILKIAGSDWKYYNSDNSRIPASMSVESIASDTENNIWIAGHDYEQMSVMKFNGNKWVKHALGYKGKKDFESIDQIYANEQYIYAISFETHKYVARIKSTTLSFNGKKWQNNMHIPSKHSVLNILINYDKNSLILNTGKELYELHTD